MNLYAIELEYLDKETIKALKKDKRIRFGLNTAFLLGKGKKDIERTYKLGLSVRSGAYAIYKACPYVAKYLTSATLRLDDAIKKMNDEHEFYNDFDNWIKKLQVKFNTLLDEYIDTHQDCVEELYYLLHDNLEENIEWLSQRIKWYNSQPNVKARNVIPFPTREGVIH
jgi:hypothetical protein